MSQPTVYFITGANRGIGLAIVSTLVARPNVVVFAGARDPSRTGDLNALAKAHPDRVHVIKVVSADKQNNEVAIEEVKQVAGRLDVVIANAGISDSYEPALEVPTEGMNRHFEVNTNGPLVLFQAAYSLLRRSATPKFVTVSSGLGSIALAGELSVNMYAYGASKAAANWVMRKLHHDFPDMVIFPISPGMAATDMAKDGVEREPAMIELQKALPPITPAESARGILEQIDVATRDTHGGQFVDYSGLGKWEW
ncbi:NAD(P)-binding protein [Schizophyllum commune H4-8]|uniref:NAD(P)-binding protein n=1 Tax=Schizophyllum commune (strain H4-8 / FGSC 9210) TaxID=578458 RepID=D8Q4X1_SCHCM|nr:NAD(P)-binding protein [Schizophyllum commune H4-8]KAI5892429.1 NAD(P)-binding protein [Schizophyllum commune H4-8]